MAGQVRTQAYYVIEVHGKKERLYPPKKSKRSKKKPVWKITRYPSRFTKAKRESEALWRSMSPSELRKQEVTRGGSKAA